ncbi:MAG: hypothetical protein V3S21_04210 [Xanthomonadales bacterium]
MLFCSSADHMADVQAGHVVSPHIAPVSRMMALDSCGWTPGWTESHSRGL